MSAETQTQDHTTGGGRRQDSPQDEREEHDSNDHATARGSATGGDDGQSYGAYVAPSSYLMPLGRPQGAGAKAGAPGHGQNAKEAEMEKRPMSAVDRDQVEGLVSGLPVTFLKEERAMCGSQLMVIN